MWSFVESVVTSATKKFIPLSGTLFYSRIFPAGQPGSAGLPHYVTSFVSGTYTFVSGDGLEYGSRLEGVRLAVSTGVPFTMQIVPMWWDG